MHKVQLKECPICIHKLQSYYFRYCPACLQGICIECKEKISKQVREFIYFKCPFCRHQTLEEATPVAKNRWFCCFTYDDELPRREEEWEGYDMDNPGAGNDGGDGNTEETLFCSCFSCFSYCYTL